MSFYRYKVHANTKYDRVPGINTSRPSKAIRHRAVKKTARNLQIAFDRAAEGGC